MIVIDSLSHGIANDVVAELVVSNLGAHVAKTSNLFVIHLVVRVGPAGRCVDKLVDSHGRRLDGRSVDQLADDDVHRDGMLHGIH